MIARRIAIAREIFTAEEIAELTKYEFIQLWETAKQHVEWFAYALVTVIWLGVVALIVSLVKTTTIEKPFQKEEIIEKTTELMLKNDEYRKAEQICKIIDENKSKKSLINSSDIYWKILLESNNWKIDPIFVLALIEKESNFYENAEAQDFSTTGSLGWSQATKSSWDTFIIQYICPKYNLTYNEAIEIYPHNEKSLYDPDLSLTFICWHLNWLKTNYSDRINSYHDLYAAYNGGPGGINKASVQKNADKFDEIYSRYFVAMK